MENLEYQLLLFGFTALQHSLERRHIIRKVLNNAMDNFIKKLCASNGTSNALLAQKTSICDSILLSLEENFNHLDTLDQKYFTVPGHVLLETDFAFSKQYTDENERELDDELSHLEQIFLQNCVFGTLLEAEEDKFMLVKAFIDDEIESHAQLTYYLDHFDSDVFTMQEKTKTLLEKM